MLCRFNGIGTQPLDIDAPRNCAFGDDRLQQCGTQFGCFLHQIFRRRFLDGRKCEPEVRHPVLFRRLTIADHSAAPARHVRNARTPLAILAIEQTHRVAVARAHDVKQIMRLRFAGIDLCAGIQRRLDKEPQPAAIVIQFAGLVRRFVRPHVRITLSKQSRLQHA